MKLTERFWCGNCGKEGTIVETTHCNCKKKQKGEKWIDKQDHYVFGGRDGIRLVKRKLVKSKAKK